MNSITARVALVNEGAGILEEGITRRASAIDVVCVHGYAPSLKGQLHC